MNTVQKVLVGLIVVGGLTTLVLPDRQSVKLAGAFTSGFQNSLYTAITGKK